MNGLNRWNLLVEPARILREGFRALIESEAGLRVAESDGHASALEALRRQPADVLVFNLGVVGQPLAGFVRDARRICPRLKLVGYDFEGVAGRAIAFVRSGCSGCLLGDFSAEDMLLAVRSAGGRGLYLNAEAAGIVIDYYLENSRRSSPATEAGLGLRERQVLELLAEGRQARGIARELGISVNSAIYHRRRIMAKLKVRSVSQLTKWAIQSGLSTP